MHHLATTLKTPDNRQPRHFSLAAMFNWLKLPLSGNHHKLTSQNGEQSEVEQFTQKSNKSVTELLCCFKIIRDVASLAEWKFLMYYLMSEQFPSIVITCFFKSANQEDPDALSEVEGLYGN